MAMETLTNTSFVGFNGGIQQLTGEDTTIILPVILGTICVIGIGGNILVLVVLMYSIKTKKSVTETVVLLANLSATDLLILAVCASVRAVTYHNRTWTLGNLACRTTEWFQHGCLTAKTFTLAVMGQTPHVFNPMPTNYSHFKLKRIVITVGTMWTLGLAFPVTDVIFSKLQSIGNFSVCVSELPVNFSDFMHVYSKVLPLVVYAIPITFSFVCHIRAIFKIIPRAHETSVAGHNKDSLALLSVTAANALMMLPEWGSWVWLRHSTGDSCKPSSVLLVFAQVCIYLASAISPGILLTMLVPLRDGLTRLCIPLSCRDTYELKGEAKKSEPITRTIVISAVDDLGRVSVVAVSGNRADAFSRTLPDLEHFWTGRQSASAPENNDPFPWERLEQGNVQL